MDYHLVGDHYVYVLHANYQIACLGTEDQKKI